jgi:hypothetical protein
MMHPVARIALVARHGKGEVVLRAYDCLGEVGIEPVGYSFNTHAFILLTPKTREKAVTTLRAAGFELREV